MKFHFRKMHGAGNDFIVLNDLKNDFPIKTELISRLCNRRLGIGADGLILIRSERDTDFRMIYFNADGKEGSMCGNGGRVAAVFALVEGIAAQNASFVAYDGIHFSQITAINTYQYDVVLSMKDVQEVEINEKMLITNTGSPHLVILSDNVSAIDIITEGRRIRNQQRFEPHGINVNFLEKKDQSFFLRTYERGVEDETLSCGTGVTAAAIAVHQWFGIEDVKLVTLGGEFKVHLSYNGTSYKDLLLEGPVEIVYEGIIAIDA